MKMKTHANLASNGYPVTVSNSIIICVKLRPIHTSITSNILSENFQEYVYLFNIQTLLLLHCSHLHPLC